MMTAATSTPALELLVLRIREAAGVAHSGLRITAAPGVLTQMVSEFIARGEVPQVGYDCVRFGPHLAVYIDYRLPRDTFAIVLRK